MQIGLFKKYKNKKLILMVVQWKNINLCKTINFKNAGSVIQNQVNEVSKKPIAKGSK